MTTIEQHISNLLYTHECVIIPDFGAFVATSVSARIDHDKNILLPPGKEIGFNRSLSHNDGLLISTYAQKKGVSYVAAKAEVEQFRLGLIDQLESGCSVEIVNVGTLKRDAIGNVQFSADNTENYLADSFGLTSFHFAPDVSVKPVNENVQVKRLLRPVTHKHIAATVALVIGLFATSPMVNDVAVDWDLNAASSIDFLVNRISSEATLVEEREVLAESLSQEELVVDEEIEENHFFVIAGSFKRQSQAEEFLKGIVAKGEKQAFVLTSPNKRYRIALDGFSNKVEAVNSMNNYRNKEDFKTVWVLKQ